MKKILITGATGFIGSWLCKYFLNDGYEIIGHGSTTKSSNDLKKNIINSNYPSENFESWTQDFLKKDWSFPFDFSTIDFIIHTAAATKVREGKLKNYDKYFNLNVVAPKRLAERALKEKISQFIHLSTGQVFGHPKNFPITEKTNKNPINLYGHTKLMGEQVVKSFGTFGLKYTIVRPFSVYGKDQENIINIVHEKIRDGEPITVYGDGTQSRAFMHIEDFYRAVKIILDNPKCIKESFSLSGDKEYSINYLIGFFSDSLNKKPEIIFEESKVKELKRNLADTSKIQKIGFTYTHVLEDFIKNELLDSER